MYNNYNQQQNYNQYYDCGQQAYEPQSPSFNMNQNFQKIWAWVEMQCIYNCLLVYDFLQIFANFIYV